MNLSEREEKRKKAGVVSSMISTQKEETKNDDEDVIQRGYYITKRAAREVKLRAIKDGKRDSDVVMDALTAYLGL